MLAEVSMPSRANRGRVSVFDSWVMYVHEFLAKSFGVYLCLLRVFQGRRDLAIASEL